jgi:hypothetical protein
MAKRVERVPKAAGVDRVAMFCEAAFNVAWIAGALAVLGLALAGVIGG